MSKLTYLDGNAVYPINEGKCVTVIPHVCNNIGKWGAGFTAGLDQRWPHVGRKFHDWHSNRDPYSSEFSDYYGLGTVDFVSCENGVMVANMVAQSGVRGASNKKPIRYASLVECMVHLKDFITSSETKRSSNSRSKQFEIHCPMFGSGLAGGKWEIIEELIKEIWVDEGIDVYVYKYKG